MEKDFIQAVNLFIEKNNERDDSEYDMIMRKVGGRPTFQVPMNALVYGYKYNCGYLMSMFSLMDDITYRPIDNLYTFAEYIDIGQFYIFIEHTNEIALTDDYEMLTYYCAKNFTVFLEALTEVYRFLSTQVLLENPYQETDCRVVGERCIAIAGGEKYRYYYECLLDYNQDLDD